jgi:hypothetical protein
MAQVPYVNGLLNTELTVKPSNYLVNQISWNLPSPELNAIEFKVVRNVEGHPRNITDGVVIYSQEIPNTEVRLEYGGNGFFANSVFREGSLSGFTFSGGGYKNDLSEDYVVYKNVGRFGTGISATTANPSATGAFFSVTRSRTDLGQVVGVEITSYGEFYTVGDVLNISGSAIGVPDVPENKLEVIVTAVDQFNGGIRSFYFPLGPGAPGSYTSVKTVNISETAGTGAELDISIYEMVTPQVNVARSGHGYSTVDVLNVDPRDIGQVVPKTKQGVFADYHIYDTGAATALTENPGKNVIGTDLNAPKYYYSVFVKYATDTDYREESITGTGLGYKNFKWAKLAESASNAVKDVGTLDVLFSHIPNFYKKLIQGNENTDLKDFLSLLAFHIDTYQAASNSVFNMSDPATADEELIKLYLKQFGTSYSNVSNGVQARVLLSNLIRNYKKAGSSYGLIDLIESFTGYGVNILAPVNLITDYNSSSFIEDTGLWYPKSSTGTFTTSLSASGFGTNSGSSPIPGYQNRNSTSIDHTDPNAIWFPAVYSTAGSKILTKSSYEKSATKLRSGMSLFISSGAGTGAFAPGTVVTRVIDDNTFEVNYAPTTALSNATVEASTNLSYGIGVVATSSTGTRASFSLGPKSGTLTANVALGATSLTVAPITASVGENVIGPGITRGTHVTAVNSSTGVITLSAPTTRSISSGTAVYFGKDPVLDKSATLSQRISVDGGKPYAFNIQVNPGVTSTTKAVTSGLVFYDKDSNVLSTVSRTLGAGSQSSSTWSAADVAGVAPANAKFVSPEFSIAAHNNAPYYVDAAQVYGPEKVTLKAKSSGVVTLSTDTPHNFVIGRQVAVSNVGAGFDGVFTITDVYQNRTEQLFTFKYANAGSDVDAMIISGYASSASFLFEDAHSSQVELVASRKNLIRNPSFFDPSGDQAQGWYFNQCNRSTTFTTSSGVSTSSTTIPVTSLSTVFVGTTIKSVTGGGAFAAGTRIVSTATSPNRVIVSAPPTVAIVSGAQITSELLTSVYSIEGSVYRYDVLLPGVVSTTSIPIEYPLENPYEITFTLNTTAGFNEFDSLMITTSEVYDTNSSSSLQLSGLVLDITGNSVTLQVESVKAGDPPLSSSGPWYVYKFDSSASVTILPPAGNTHGIVQRINGGANNSTIEVFYNGLLTTQQYSSTPDGSSYSRIVIEPNEVYTFSAYVHSINSARYFDLVFKFYDTEGNLITTMDSSNVEASDSQNINAWTRHSHTVVSPSNAASVVPSIRIYGAAINDQFTISNTLFERSSILKPYFDGSFDGQDYNITRDSLWENRVGDSVSHFYTDRVGTFAKIDTLVTDVLYYG